MIRRLMREVVEGARDSLRDVWSGTQGDGLSNEEAVARYVQQHRGRPAELLAFAARHADGPDVLAAAVEYEQQMERMLRGGV